jgi:hypothetical protein
MASSIRQKTPMMKSSQSKVCPPQVASKSSCGSQAPWAWFSSTLTTCASGYLEAEWFKFERAAVLADVAIRVVEQIGREFGFDLEGPNVYTNI